ncbi:MAG: ImmA/IrrE family metallo-endopeptidase, partial [Alphaproteobacteria bacterium]|nr:ImmA/IrrE family metallo-endopeptidase [Alphaproteobacteria bacterium]
MVRNTKTSKPSGNPKIGGKIRRLRRDSGKTQAQLADQLGVSASYLNLIEHNHRKVTVDMLLKLSEIFGLEMRDLAEGDESQILADVMAVLGDDLFEELDLTNMDVRDFVSTAPQVARAMLILNDSLQSTLSDVRNMATRLAEEEGDGGIVGFSATQGSVTDVISDFFQDNSNFFSDLEDEAARIRREIETIGAFNFDTLCQYMQTALDVRVVLSEQIQAGFQRRFDPATKQLILSPHVDVSSRNFQVAHQIGLMSAEPVIDMLLMEGRVREGGARHLGRVALANYLAAAIIMPYDRFLATARQYRYDIELLQHRYEVSFEQVAQRLTTLNNPSNKGVPLHFLRVDIAGNISKRFSLSGLPIPRHG